MANSCISIYLYITRVPGSLGTRAPSNLHGNPGSFFRVSDLHTIRRRNKGVPSPEMSSKSLPKWVPIGHPSSPEELLNLVFVKKLRCRIRTCLPMFAAHLVACKSNIFVIQGCNIDANMDPNLHAENGHTFNRKVSNMKSKCGPEGVPKIDQKAISNGNLRFWTRSGDIAWSLPVVLAPAHGMGARMVAKKPPNGVVNQARVAYRGHLRGIFGASQCSLNPETLEPSTAGIIFQTSLDGL